MNFEKSSFRFNQSDPDVQIEKKNLYKEYRRQEMSCGRQQLFREYW